MRPPAVLAVAVLALVSPAVLAQSPPDPPERAADQAPTAVEAGDAEVVTELPIVGPQVFPWPLRGDVLDCFLDEAGTAWLPTSLGEVARLDLKRARSDPRDPAAWTVYDLGPDLYLSGATGFGKKVWVVGRTGSERGVVFEWNGNAWRGVYLGARERCGQIYDAIALSEDELYASGYADSIVVVHRDATGWHEEGGAEAHDLYQFLVRPGGGLFASGSLGQIYRLTEGGWRVHTQLPVRGPIVSLSEYRGRMLVPCEDRIFLVADEAVEELPPFSGREHIQTAVGLGDAIYAVDGKAVLWRLTDGKWLEVGSDPPLATSEGWTGVRLTRLDDETLLGFGTRGMVFLLASEKRTDLSFGWRATGDFVTCVPPGGDFAVAATAPIRRPRATEMPEAGYVILARRNRIRVVRAPTLEVPGAVFARSMAEVYLLTLGGLVHRFDGETWELLTKERLKPDWARVGFDARGALPFAYECFKVIHSPEPGVVIVANPLFRLADGVWTQLDLPAAFRARAIPVDTDRLPPGVFGPCGGWEPHWDWPKITAIDGTSATDVRLETSLYPLHFDGGKFEAIHDTGDRRAERPTNPFYREDEVHSGAWLRVR